MRFFSRLTGIFIWNFIRLFFKNTWSQIATFVDILGLIFIFFPTLNTYVLCFLIVFTIISFLAVAIFILGKEDYKVVTKPESTYLEHSYHINSIVLSTEEKFLASCGGDHYAILWDVSKSQLISRFQHSSAVSKILFSPDCNYLYSLASKKGSFIKWDLFTKQEVYKKSWFNYQNVDGTFPITRGLSISDDGSCGVISSEQGSFVFLDLTQNIPFFQPKKISEYEIRTVLFIDKLVILASSDGVLFKVSSSRDLINSDPEIIYKDENCEMIRSLNYNKINNLLAFTDSGGYLNLMNMKSGKVSSIKAHNGHAVAVCFSRSGKFVATGGQDAIIKIWEIKLSGIKCLFEIHGHSRSVTSLVFDGNNRLFSASRDQSIKLWNLHGLG